MTMRKMMEVDLLEYAVALDSKILAGYYEAPSVWLIERMIKPAQFSLDMAPTPSPTTNKRCKFSGSFQGQSSGQPYVQLQMRNVLSCCKSLQCVKP